MQGNTFFYCVQEGLTQIHSQEKIGILSCALLSLCIAAAFWSSVETDLAFIKEVRAGGHSE